MEKEDLLKDLSNHPDFFLMLVSLYYKFSYKELKQYKTLLNWGGRKESVTIISDDPFEKIVDISYTLGIVFNQNLKWSKKKFNLYKETKEYYESTFNELEIKFKNKIFPFILSDVIEANITRTIQNTDLSGPDISYSKRKEDKLVDLIQEKEKSYYPSVFQFTTIDKFLTRIENQRLSFDEGLLLNPQIWERYYRWILSKKDINKLLEEIYFRKFEEDNLNPNEYGSEYLDEADIEF
jgi:hypothetical protein